MVAANKVRDRKTGKIRNKNLKRSKIAKKAAKSRVNKRRSTAVRTKISKALKKTHKRGKTVFGRKVIKRKTPVRKRTVSTKKRR